MRAPSACDIRTVQDALALLGLGGPADAETLGAAFRAAVKAARPDQPGGDDARFRQVIAAYRLIQAQAPARLALVAPTRRRPAPPVTRLTPHQALSGGTVTLTLPARRRLRVAIPPGLRNGQHLRLQGAGRDGSDLYSPILILAGDGLSVLGDDLYMDWPVPERTIQDGGRIEIPTHAGPRSAWVVAGLDTPVRLRLRGLGLPARGRRAQGHLFVSLIPSADAPSAAEDLLARFTRLWTPERLAA